jgi:choline dehydrogenase-like flavoprotein
MFSTRAPASSTVVTDVCVIGAGPAGLTFARSCIGSTFEVLVLEGGLYVWDEQAQDLRSSAVDSPYYRPDALSVGRRRQFGGTANIWSHVTRPDGGRVYARALPAEAIDFEARDWQPTGGWPIGLGDLLPYYDRVARAWIGRPVDNETTTWSRPGSPPLPLREGPLRTKVAQYGANDVFTGRYRDEIFVSDNVRVQVDSTVVELESDRPGSTIRRARVRRADGSTYFVEADVFVMAGGTVENVQTLLHSDATRPGAVGNKHDNVGRYVTDHSEFLMGTIRPSDPQLVEQLGLYDLHYVDDSMVSGLLTFDEDYKRDQQLLNMAAVLLPQPAGFGTAAERAIRSLRPLGSGQLPPEAMAHLRSILASPRDSVAVVHDRLVKRRRRGRDYKDGYVWHRGGWSRPGIDRSKLPVLEVHAATEQSPERDNALQLTGVLDGLGRRRVKLTLGWSAPDRENLLRTVDAFGAEIEGSGLGTFHRWIEFTGETRPVTHGVHHPMGGTRMHADPRVGVVDETCRVHGVSNLYLAGSSVFTTGLGYANPTLTLLALSVRLADHIASVLGRTNPLDAHV